jgi:DNA helicase-2/ATP-dependent DNA helicase PcrA
VKNILDFDKDFPDCKTYKLEENYRSTGNILSAAGAVVKAVSGRKEKTLWTKKEPGDLVTVRVADDEWKEAEFVAREITKRIDAGDAAWSDFAIFYRTNAQSRVIEECLNMRSIPHRIYGGLKFYARKEVKDIMAYLRLAINERDEIGFLRAIASPPRGIGSVSIAKLRDFAANNGLSLLNASAKEPETLPATAKGKLKQFHSLIGEIREAIATRPAGEVIMLAVEKSGYLQALLKKKTAQDNSRAENLQELVSAPYKNETLTEFLERTALVADADNVDESADSVSLMTLHVSKGLEFPVVFLVGMEENLFPHANSMGSVEEIDEERRLCYVGMTRAMRKLFMTCAAKRRFLGSLSFNNPSIFLSDLPEETVEVIKPGAGVLMPAYEPADINFDEADETADGFNVGMVVKHPHFGPGVIRKREGDGDDMNLTVKFKKVGVKKLKQKFARLTLA